MRLVKIEGEFVRQYPSLSLDFTEPFKGTGRENEPVFFNINGPNGAGKTTIFSLVELCLFGNITDITSSEIKYDEALKNQKWWARLTFRMNDGNEYAVYRHETTAKAALDVNGIRIAEGQKEVTSHIVKKILRMDQKSFLNAFYARQNDFDNLIKMGNEERKKEISRLLNIDVLDKVIKQVREDKKMVNVSIEESKKHIKPSSAFESEMLALNEEMRTVMKKESEQEVTVKEREKIYEQTLKEKESLDGKYEQFQSLSSSIREKEQENKHLSEITLSSLQKELEEIAKIKNEFAELQTSVAELDTLQKEFQAMQKAQVLFIQKQQAMKQLEHLKERLISKKERLEGLKKELPENTFAEQAQEIDNKIGSLEKEIQTENQIIIELKSNLTYVSNEGKRFKEERQNITNLGAESPCPICKRGMGEHYHSLKGDLDKEIERLVKEHQTITTTISGHEKKIVDVNNSIAELRKAKREIEIKQTDFIKKENEYKVLHKDFQNEKKDYIELEESSKQLEDVSFYEEEFNLLSEKVSSYQKKKERFNVLAALIAKEPSIQQQIETIQVKLNDNKVEIAGLNKQISSLEFDLEVYRNSQQKIAEEVKMLREAESSFNTVKEDKKRIEVLLQNLEKEMKANAEIEEKLKEKKKELDLLLITEELYKNYKIDRMAKVKPRIEGVMSNLLSYITDGKYDSAVLDDHFNVFVYRNGIKKPFHRYSGGEQKLIALCLRLAISEIITLQREQLQFDYLALDEVLGAMDEGRQETIINALKKLNHRFKQIIMITHNSNLKELFDCTLQIEQNNDLSSKAYWLVEECV